MNAKLSVAFFAAILAAVGLLAPESKVDPAAAARLNNLGCAYMNQQLFEKGLSLFQQAEEADPHLAIAQLNQGIALLNLQKVEAARPLLEAARDRDPKSAGAWYNLGLLAKNSGDAQAAIEDFKRVTGIDPNDADTWYMLGSAYVQARQFAPAIEAFQRALQVNPLHATAEFGLSRASQQSGDVEHARDYLKKFQYITQNKLGAPLSLAYGEQGQYSRAVESPLAVLKPPPQIKVQFVDVTKEAGLPVTSISNEEGLDSTKSYGLGSGACLLDYDNDGRIDIFFPDNGTTGTSLYHNLGADRFEDVTKRAGLDPALHASSCTAGDYDNDGFTDLAVVLNERLLLFHNQTNGTFKNATQESGIENGGAAVGATFVDYDHDGDLDLLILQSGRRHPPDPSGVITERIEGGLNEMWRNNGNGTFTNRTEATGLEGRGPALAAVGTDFNNDRAVDLVVDGATTIFENPREGKFLRRNVGTRNLKDPLDTILPTSPGRPGFTVGVAVLDFDHDGWMDIAFTHMGAPGLTLWRNNHGKSFEQVKLPETNWVRAYGVAAFDYDNDGWVDLVAVGETKDGKGEIKLFRNLGPDGFKDVTADVGLDKIHLESPRAIITGDYDNDGAVDLLITQNHGPAVLLRNVVLPNPGGNQNHWLRLALKGLNDNKSAIGTKVEVFSGGNRQKFEIYGSNGYLGQNSPYLTVGLGDAKEADIVRMLWPTGVLQDEIQVAGDRQQDILEIDRRGSSCPTLFVWNGQRYEFVADMLGAGVVGHWIGPGQRDIPRPVEWIKVDRGMIRKKQSQNPHPVAENATRVGQPRPILPTTNDQRPATTLSFRFMEPLEEAVYLD